MRMIATSATFALLGLTGCALLLREAGSGRPRLEPRPIPDVVLVPFGAAWSYAPSAQAPDPGWMTGAFDDSDWPTGRAEIGYGDGDAVTRLRLPRDAEGGRRITTYLRHSFAVDDPGRFDVLYLDLVRDDGAVVYLNGREVARSNMPEFAPAPDLLATDAVSGPGEKWRHRHEVRRDLLRRGRNVLAVEVHQASAQSSDMSFDARLTASGNPLLRGPYLQTLTASSVLLRWRTAEPLDSRVRYGRTPDVADGVVDDRRLTTEHELRLSHLLPGVRYFYSVGTSRRLLAGGDEDHFFETAPMRTEKSSARIWVLGDPGTADASARAVRDGYRRFAGSNGADLLLILGDGAYPSGTDSQYQSALFEMYGDELRRMPAWPAFGDHDRLSADPLRQRGVYFDVFSLPRSGEAGGVPSDSEAYYAFDYGNVHFVCLDSSGADHAAMLAWVAADLAASQAEWTIAFSHHPPYSKGVHDSDVDIPSTTMRQDVLPILEQGGVDLLISGHGHVYERSALLDSHYGVSDSLRAHMVLDAGDGQPDRDGPYRKSTRGRSPHEGTVYMVVGSSGRVLPGPLNHPAMKTAYAGLGSAVIDVTGGVLDARFIDEQGRVVDRFRIEKGGLRALAEESD